jgi:hypothetical protein
VLLLIDGAVKLLNIGLDFLDTGGKTSIKFDIEIEGQRKPALSGIASFLYYFNN